MTRETPVLREATLAAGGAAALAALLVWLGPPGADRDEHAYPRTLFLNDGFALWNNFWYAGRYSFVTYSVLYYPLAALLGIKLLAVATVSTAALIPTVAASAASRLLETLLYGVTRGDVVTYAAVVALLGGVSVLACWAPARRAAGVDPVITLRSE